MDSGGSGLVPLASFCENWDEPSGFITGNLIASLVAID
jgi:hypothetical protein